MKPMVNYKDLIQLGFKEHQARSIIHQAKVNLVEQGLTLYNGKRIGVVPVHAVEKIVGFPLLEDGNDKIGKD